MTPDLTSADLAELAPNVREVDLREFVDLLTSRRALERVWPFGVHGPDLRGALRDPYTGAVYRMRREPRSREPMASRGPASRR